MILASGVSRPCRQFVRTRKIRITYNITVCTRRVGPLDNTITVTHRDVTVRAIKSYTQSDSSVCQVLVKFEGYLC